VWQRGPGRRRSGVSKTRPQPPRIVAALPPYEDPADPTMTHLASLRLRAPRVVVTGIGLRTALGNDRETSWMGLRSGRHGCRILDVPAAAGAPPYAGYPIRHSDHRATENLWKAAMEAVADAQLRKDSFDPERAGTVLGMSKGDLVRLAHYHRAILPGSNRPELPPNWVIAWPNAGAAFTSIWGGLRGPCLVPIAACATGLVAALQAADLIRRGDCDLALAGAGEASLAPLVLGAFRRMGVFPRIREGDDPARAVRPWDRSRSGFLVGEGAAVLVLEREDHARARGALPYCEFAGGALGSDAYHMTDLNPDPANLAGLIGRALAWSGVEASEIDHVNVHGTATRVNDPLECQALRLALGAHADTISCSASKAQIGHCLGAAGAVELALTCLAVRDGFVPPTLNLNDPDPRCDLDATPHVGRARPIRAALKLSLGFGGHLAAAVVRQAETPRREPPRA
jgi:3-oxoacyl-[acyl-carrier-protein] synthase II